MYHKRNDYEQTTKDKSNKSNSSIKMSLTTDDNESL